MEQDELNCSICYRLAIQAVQCAQSKCKKLYCKACHDYILAQNKHSQKTPKCPFCRAEKFIVKESTLRQKINNKPTKCRFCFKMWKYSQIQKHECECDQKKVKCQICSKVLKKKEIVAHTKTNHKEKIDKIVMDYHIHKYPLVDPKLVLEKQAIKFKFNQKPHLGKTGKFYCLGDLQAPKCNCCNGKCGPTNGQNCLKCMHLDMVRRGLTKGHLVHAGGAVCWLDNKEHFTCGLMYSQQRKSCGKEGYCLWCRNIQITMKRYQSLL